MLTIKDMKSMNEGTQIKGVPLLIKTARKPFRDAEGTTYQEVVFMDATGEMTGHIFLEETESDSHCQKKAGSFKTWESKTNLCILDAEIQCTDERKKEGVKLVVFDCFDAAVQLTYDQQQELSSEDWKKLREDEIRGKCRHGVTCAFIMAGKTSLDKKEINEIVDFIISGDDGEMDEYFNDPIERNKYADKPDIK